MCVLNDDSWTRPPGQRVAWFLSQGIHVPLSSEANMMTRSRPFSRSVTWGRWADCRPWALKIHVWLHFEFLMEVPPTLEKSAVGGLKQPTPPSVSGTAACSNSKTLWKSNQVVERLQPAVTLPGVPQTEASAWSSPDAHHPRAPRGTQGRVAIGRPHHAVHVVRSPHRLQSPGPQPPPWFKSLSSAVLGPIRVLCH